MTDHPAGPVCPPVSGDDENYPAVAAILAVTPKTSTGQVAHRYEVLPDLLLGVPCDAAAFGDPTPIAEGQAAAARRAIYRELADQLDAKADAESTNPRYRPRLYLDAPRLRALADEIEEANRG